jgi:hypothetical protein
MPFTEGVRWISQVLFIKLRSQASPGASFHPPHSADCADQQERLFPSHESIPTRIGLPVFIGSKVIVDNELGSLVGTVAAYFDSSSRAQRI